MKFLLALFLGLVATMFAGGSDAAQSESANSQTQEHVTVDKDFGRLSDDGVSAFNDIHLARMNIFDGFTDQAAKLVSDALASLRKAKSDNEAFMKAESALHGPSNPGPRSGMPASATPIAWLPIDSEIIMGRTYKSTPEKAAAIVDANKNLERGESDKALERIRLAAVDVDYILALAPLDQSIAEVEEANRLMSNHDFYGANQALRETEMDVRYDQIEDIAHVRHAGDKGAASGK